MKNSYLKILYLLVGALFIYIIVDNIFFPPSISYENTSIIRYEKDTIYVDYYKMNSLLDNINDYIKYGNSLEAIYNEIIDNYYDNEKAKMYDEGNYKVLELTFDKEKAKSLFNNYINITSDVKVKVLFDESNDLENIDIEKINFKLNREQVIRENIVKTAVNELGKTGETYWNWYGFDHRVEWCCVFVSWVANQNGVLNTKIPKFIWVKKGVDFYKEKEQLKFPKEYTPQMGDIIFFDWNQNGVIDHVGIVEKVEKGYVYSIEGNVDYKDVQRRKSKLNASYIYAYGSPDY